MKKLLLIVFLLSVGIAKSQKVEKLRVGEKIAFSKITVINQNHKDTHIELPNGKTTIDRFVLIYFYSPDKPIKELMAFNNEVERILNKFQNNSCKGASEIEYVTICASKDFKTWENILNETGYNKPKFTGKKINGLAEKGLKDKLLEIFKVTDMPSLFLVNPKGRLYLETNNVEELNKTFLNICRNSSNATADLTGKILGGEKGRTPLTEQKVYLIKGENDTINNTLTDNFGDFVFKQVDTTQKLSIRLEASAKNLKSQKVYLAKQSGEVVSEFKKSSSGTFEYKLLTVDVATLSEIEDEEDITMKYKKFSSSNKKDFTIAENIYYDLGKYNIVTQSEIILDKVIGIMNASPNVKLEVISHTDAQGDDAANLKLSEQQSEAVINYLISKGISTSRLKGIGKGEHEIRNRCTNGVSCSDKEHEYNRRTEFKFIKN